MHQMLAEGFVLTGGRSSRFGSDKALHVVDGLPMALHVARALRTCTRSVTLVGDPGRHASLGLPVVPDRIADAGPLGGIVTALSGAESPWILVVACDMPQLTAPPLQRLLRAASSSQAAAVLPRTPDLRIQPLCAAYSKHSYGPLRNALRSGIRKVMEAVERIAWEPLDYRDAGPFANVNRLTDLAGLGRNRPLSTSSRRRGARGRRGY